MPSDVSCIKREVRNHSAMVPNRLNGKLDKLSERQDRLLRNGYHSNVVIMDGHELPKFVLDILSLGPKHPVRDKFNEVNFLADVDKLLRELRENNTEGEKLCEIEASAKWYPKAPLDGGVKKVHDYCNGCSPIKVKENFTPPSSFQRFQICPDIVFFAVNFCELYYPLYCRIPLHYLLFN